MRIWVIYRDATPPDRTGFTRWHFLGREMVRRGHQVTIIASTVCHRTKRPHTDAEQETVDGIAYRWLKGLVYKGRDLRRVLDNAWFAKQVSSFQGHDLHPPDVIIGSSPPPFGALGAARLARRLGVPFVLEARDLWPQFLIDVGGVHPWHPFVLLLGRTERRLYHDAKVILALHPQAAKYMHEKWAVDIGKVHWFPHVVDLAHFPPPTPPPVRDHFVVMYAGSHGVTNAMEHVVDAARLLQKDPDTQHVRFRLIGSGPEKPTLVRRAAGLQNLVFEPEVSGERVPLVLAEADAFVISARNSPLYRYGIAMNKFADYMAMARPIVIGVDSHTPMADAASALIVPPEQPASLAAAIKQLSKMSSAERWQMGLRGRHYVEEHLTVQRLADRLESLIPARCFARRA